MEAQPNTDNFDIESGRKGGTFYADKINGIPKGEFYK